MSILVLNFSIESAKKLILYDLLSSLQFILLNNEKKHPSGMRNEHHNIHFTVTEVFLVWGSILTAGLKY